MPKTPPEHVVLASDFASLKDLQGYKKAKQNGATDIQAFAVGDNGIGCWGHNTAQLQIPMCALPPDDMIARWGSTNAAEARKVRVTIAKRSVVCVLADRMPWKKNIKNGCGIDLNPAALVALGKNSPLRAQATWIWEDDLPIQANAGGKVANAVAKQPTIWTRILKILGKS